MNRQTSSRKSSYRSNNNRLKGDEYISTQELQEKLVAEQERIRIKRQNMREQASKRQQAQAQSILFNRPGSGSHSSLFADYVERSIDTTDDEYDIGPDFAATPLDAIADGFTKLCSPTSVTYGMDPTPASYYRRDLEDTASISRDTTDLSRSTYDYNTSIDDGTSIASIAYDSEISSLTDLNRYKKPAWWKKKGKHGQSEDDTPPHETIMQHLGKQSPSYVKEFLKEKQQEDLACPPAGESTSSEPPINVIRTPSKMTFSNSEDSTTLSYTDNEEENLARISSIVENNHVVHDDDEDAAARRRTQNLLFNAVSMLDRDDDEETNLESINTEEESLKFKETPTNLVGVLSCFSSTKTAEENQRDQLRSEKEIARSKALKKIRELSEQERDRQRASKEERMANKKAPVWYFSRMNCKRKCRCNQYCICKACTLHYLGLVACMLLLMGCIVGIILLLVDPFNEEQKPGINHASGDLFIDDASSYCLRETNIMSKCQCKSELLRELSSDFSFYRKLMLQYLVNAQIIPFDQDVLIQEDEEITKLFVESEESCNSYNQVLLFLTDADKQSDESDGLNALAHRFVLVLLYQILGGQFWYQQKNWAQKGDSFVNECDGWHGISCSSKDEILQINLSNNKLQGDLTTITRVLGRGLPDLRELNLSHNPGVYGKFALDELLAQANLLPTLQKLDLSFGSFYGATIPTEIGRLSRLTELNLGHGQWEGTLPTELGLITQLRVLDLSNNVLEGTLPKELGKLTQLRRLNLSHNILTGELPDEQYGDLRLLESVDVSDNALQGRLPQSWKGWDQLQALILKGNTW
eukprot:CAMPEP_0194227412 /NCGR_PEP_ID=MMETSP0156-20130528/42844_1 /TAXON_ID=33649 /ORGANISM="Thalassionema nitzschioides, Strain L26-B" /LENGTH=812 /DNA_ID=CAMNT_0038959893 /DNA_START=51 /DNA_END=2486 /DNA_ORIENTATION=-